MIYLCLLNECLFDCFNFLIFFGEKTKNTIMNHELNLIIQHLPKNDKKNGVNVSIELNNIFCLKKITS